MTTNGAALVATGALLVSTAAAAQQDWDSVEMVVHPVAGQVYYIEVSFHINGERVRAFKTPDAHTNNDSYVVFEGSNVVHTGDIYRTTSYPYIDTANGGSFLGTIEALDVLIGISDAETRIIPGHGVISDVGEVRAWREMLLTIRDRVKSSVDAGMSLDQIQSAGLTEEFDARWDSGRRIGGAAGLLEAAWADLAP